MRFQSEPGKKEKPKAEKPNSSWAEPVLSNQLATRSSYQFLSMLGAAFVIFECLFLVLYAGDFWFDLDISYLGVPAVVVSLFLAHFLLVFLESPMGCRMVAFFRQGTPVHVYKKWLAFGDSGIDFGIRHVRFEAIDELELSRFGNLIVKSRQLCGPEQAFADIVFKISLGAAAPAKQRQLVDLICARNATCKVDARLKKRLAAKEPKGAEFVQMLGPALMFLVLLDVGNSTLCYLQMMKQYYLSQVEARAGHAEAARGYLVDADRRRLHPFLLSFVNAKLLSEGVIGAGVHQARSEALWYLPEPKKAIAEARIACKLAPKSYRYNLRLARLLAQTGNTREARAQISEAVDAHYKSLLPRLYMLAVLMQDGHVQPARNFYALSMDDLSEQVFGDEPMWPPGGNRFVYDFFYTDDIKFVLGNLLATGQGSKPAPAR